MPITHLFAGVPAADFDSALSFYERVFGRPPDRLPKAGEAVWQLTETGLIYLVADAERAGRALITLIVDDLDERVRNLASRGIAPLGVDEIAGVARTTKIIDPDGNALTLAQLDR